MDSPLRQFGKRVDDYVYSRAIEMMGGGAQAYERLALHYEKLGWFEEAANTYKKAIQKKPFHGAYHARLASAFIKLGRFDEAMVPCQEALKLNTPWPLLYYWLGLIHQKNGDRALAIESFRRAIRQPLGEAEAYNAIGKFFADAELFEDAVHAYREIIRIRLS